MGPELAMLVVEWGWFQFLAPAFAMSYSFDAFSPCFLCSPPQPGPGCLGAAPAHLLKICQPLNAARASISALGHWGGRGVDAGQTLYPKEEVPPGFSFSMPLLTACLHTRL